MSVSFISRGSRVELALGCRVPLMFKELQSSLNINRTSRSQLCMLLNTFLWLILHKIVTMQQWSLFYCTCFTRSSPVPLSGSMLKTIKRTGIYLTTSWECYKRQSVKSVWSVAVSRKGKETCINCPKICGNQSLLQNKALPIAPSALSLNLQLPLVQVYKAASGSWVQHAASRDQGPLYPSGLEELLHYTGGLLRGLWVRWAFLYNPIQV